MNTGVVPPPPGVLADFNAPNTLRKWNILCQAVCLSTSSIAVGMRLYTKIRIVGTMRLGIEDWTCLVSWLMLLAYGAMATVFTNIYGGGEHIWNLDKQKLQHTLAMNNDLEIVYGPTVLFTKCSLLLLYARIFAPVRKSITWWSIYTLLWFIVMFYISVTFTKIFECMPRARIWDHSVKGKCVDNGILLVVTGSINLATDVFILILPIFKVWGLHLSAERRIGVMAVFALGSLAPVATILRLEQSIRHESDPDVTYAYFGILLWTVAEITTGIICASLPILPAFFRHFYPKIRGHISVYTSRSRTSPAKSTFTKGSHVSNANAGNSSHPGVYLELEEIEGLRSPNMVSSTATAEGRFSQVEWDESNSLGIMKSTQISQVREAI